MLRAGSLLYAIYVCLIIALFLGGLIHIFSINKLWASRELIKHSLVERCNTCFDFILENPDKLSTSGSSTIGLFNDGLLCNFEISSWGYFYNVSVNAFFKKDTITKSYLVGNADRNQSPALYLSDSGQELKVSGTTRITGDMYLPRKKYNVVNILGNTQINRPVITGKVFSSSQNLPPIQPIFLNLKYIKPTTTLQKIKKNQKVIRSFTSPPMFVHLDRGESLDGYQLKGNFYIISNDTLQINHTSMLEDVIIKAPKVIIDEGFEGNLQIFGDKEVIIRSKVKLKYPSLIVIPASSKFREKKIMIEKETDIYGGLLIDGSDYDEKQKNHIIIDESSTILGDIYCNGLLQLNGKVFGSVYTHQFNLETKSSKYSNVILNGEIDPTELPDDYISLSIKNNLIKQRFAKVKNIQ